MFVILCYSQEANIWRLVPDGLYFTKEVALHDAHSFGLHNPDKEYKVYRLSEVKGQ